MTFIIISVLLFAIYTFLMVLYATGWHLQKTPAAGVPHLPLPHLSIIIPARNEADNIGPCLRSILACTYPAHLLELIVIDDFSTDNTAALAEALLRDTGRVLRLENYLSADERLNSYKKKALEVAIREAKGQWIITTDADCIVPPTWLDSIATATQTESVRFIAAPVSFSPALGRKKHPVLFPVYRLYDHAGHNGGFGKA